MRSKNVCAKRLKIASSLIADQFGRDVMHGAGEEPAAESGLSRHRPLLARLPVKFLCPAGNTPETFKSSPQAGSGDAPIWP